LSELIDSICEISLDISFLASSAALTARPTRRTKALLCDSPPNLLNMPNNLFKLKRLCLRWRSDQMIPGIPELRDSKTGIAPENNKKGSIL